MEFPEKEGRLHILIDATVASEQVATPINLNLTVSAYCGLPLLAAAVDATQRMLQ